MQATLGDTIRCDDTKTTVKKFAAVSNTYEGSIDSSMELNLIVLV